MSVGQTLATWSVLETIISVVGLIGVLALNVRLTPSAVVDVAVVDRCSHWSSVADAARCRHSQTIASHRETIVS